MTKDRTERIDDAICAGAALVSALMEVGPVNSAQANVIIQAAVRASVSNAEFWEIAERARVIITDVGGKHADQSGNI